MTKIEKRIGEDFVNKKVEEKMRNSGGFEGESFDKELLTSLKSEEKRHSL